MLPTPARSGQSPPNRALAPPPAGVPRHSPPGLSYAAIPQITSLPKSLRRGVRNAFSNSLKVLWYVLVGISAIGFLSSLMMWELKMRMVADEKLGLNEEKSAKTVKPDELSTPDEKLWMS